MRITLGTAELFGLLEVFLSVPAAALEAAERAVMVLPRAKDTMDGPRFEENLA
jgi:hypothetical protein